MTRPTIAVWDLGGTGPTTLYAHATGFHGRCWSPVAARLPHMHNVAYDARGHGDTPIGEDWNDGVDWHHYGDDAEYMAGRYSEHGSLVGVGHSMGGAALLMAALNRPELFRGLVIYEPIVLPPGHTIPSGAANYLAEGARRRRRTFPSYENAIENFGSKPPLNIFPPEALEAYVRGGFRLGEDGAIHLKCSGRHEARTYEGSGSHDTWQRLPELQVPVWLLSGAPEELQPSSRTKALAEMIPNSRYVQLDHLSHFGPMQAPDEIAQLIDEAAATF
jgi:pimeloyl-ACP methyl ester carboxylesterase